ncbi:MAG: hypothetical protein QOI11_1715, partial [Candidatus Eremiobacteraeota bacterium]|nr:hypothetical protein [Candidatus Eremiobacteraeota bacterium]
MRTNGSRYAEGPASPRGPRVRAAGVALALAVVFVGSGSLAAPAPARSAPGRVHLVARDEPVRDVFLRLGEQAHLNVTLADDV